MAVPSFLLDWDRQGFSWINSRHSPWLDTLASWVSARPVWIPLYLFLAYLIWRRYSWPGMLLAIAGAALLILFTDQFSSSVIKPLFHRLRPCDPAGYFQGDVHIVNGFRSTSYGFVSSHAANFFALAFFAGMILREQWAGWGILLVFVAILVSWSRIYMGVHYPADVIGGGILGACSGIVMWWVWQKIVKRIPGSVGGNS